LRPTTTGTRRHHSAGASIRDGGNLSSSFIGLPNAWACSTGEPAGMFERRRHSRQQPPFRSIFPRTRITSNEMKSLWQEDSRRELTSRLERLSPESKAMWGRMNASQMVAHLTNSLLMTKGELQVKSKHLPIRYPPIKQLIVYWLPFPRRAPTAPELIGREPNAWPIESGNLRTLIDEFPSPESQNFPEHPLFGPLTPKAWGVLGYRHIDHHFRQFGV